MKPIRLTPQAVQDLEDAAAYYHDQAPGIDASFLEEVRTVLDAIRKSPEAFGQYDAKTRMKMTHRFPYVVFYHEAAQEIAVLAIAHGSRRPGYWKNPNGE